MDELRRKARIRNEAIENKNEDGSDGHNIMIMDFDEIQEMCCLVRKQIGILEENSYITPSGKIETSRKFSKIVKFIKRVIYKLIVKLCDWYYMPIIDMQNRNNEYCVEIIKNLSKIIENQNYYINKLIKNQVEEENE